MFLVYPEGKVLFPCVLELLHIAVRKEKQTKVIQGLWAGPYINFGSGAVAYDLFQRHSPPFFVVVVFFQFDHHFSENNSKEVDSCSLTLLHYPSFILCTKHTLCCFFFSFQQHFTEDMTVPLKTCLS